MKRILFLSYYFPPDLSAGSFRSAGLVKQLSKNKNIIIDIITTIPNRYSSYINKSLKNEFSTLENVNIIRVKNVLNSNNFLFQIISFLFYFFYTIIYVRKKKYDLIFATSSRLMTAFLGSLISYKKSIPFYLDIRDLFLDSIKSVNFIFYIFFYPIFYFIEKFTIKKANKLNLVSYGFKEYIFEKYSLKNISYYTNGIDESFLNIEYYKADNFKKLNKDLIKILYAGNIGEGQGLEKILPLMLSKNQKNILFKIIGDGKKLKKLKKFVSKLNIKNCIFLPPMDRMKLIEEYINADILFLHLNDFKAFNKVLPSKIFEYAATGKPILAGVSGYSAEFLEKKVLNSKVFPPGNINEALKCINQLILQKTNRQDFINEYSREKISKNMSNDILSIL